MNAYAALLLARGITIRPPFVSADLELRDDSDGQGLKVIRWNVPVLGAQPTPAEVAAVTAQDIATARETILASINSEQKDIVATCALLVKMTNAGWATMTVAQRIQAVRDAVLDWRTLRAFVERSL